MKRLLGEDRERMIKSRAVPEGFDTRRSLHSPYLRSPHAMGVPMKVDEENAHPSDMANPLGGNHISSPSSVSSNPDGSYAAASSVTTSGAMSPVSSLHETPYVSESSLSPRANPHPMSRYPRSLSFPQIYHNLSRPSNHPDAEQASRRRAESLAAPLGVGLPFAEVDWDQSTSHQSRLERSPYPRTNQYPRKDCSNSFGMPVNVHPATAQEICPPENHTNNPSDMLWPSFPIPTSGARLPHDISAAQSEFGLFAHTGSMIENFNSLQCSESEAMEGPTPLFLTDGDMIPLGDVYYHHMNPVGSYSDGFTNPFLQ